jgi:hypothetical protein
MTRLEKLLMAAKVKHDVSNSLEIASGKPVKGGINHL